MHSRRVLDEQSLWNQSWLTDPEKKWIETGRSRSNTTISPGTLANGQRRARSGSQSTVIAEPTPREKMLQSLNNVASLSTENPNAAQQKAYDTSNNQQELKANTGVRGSFQSLDPAMNKGPQNETSTTSRANARLGNQSSRLENVVEEGGMGSSIGDDPHPSSQNTRQNLGLGARVGNIVPRYVHSGPIENTPRQSASTANAYWDEMPDRNDNSNYDRAPPGMSAYQTGSNLGHIDSMGFQTHGSQNDNLSYSQTQPEHVSAFARARAATTPLSFSRDYESGTDLRHHYDARGEQEYKEYGVQAFRPRDRAYSVAHERSAEYSEQSAGEHAVRLVSFTLYMNKSLMSYV